MKSNKIISKIVKCNCCLDVYSTKCISKRKLAAKRIAVYNKYLLRGEK